MNENKNKNFWNFTLGQTQNVFMLLCRCVQRVVKILLLGSTPIRPSDVKIDKQKKQHGSKNNVD